MLAFVIAPFLIALLVLIYRRAIKSVKPYKSGLIKVVIVIFGLLLFSGIVCTFVGFLLPNGSIMKRILTEIGYYWFGFIIYFFIGLAIALLCRSIIWLFARKRGYNNKYAKIFTVIFVLIFTSAMSIYGILNAHRLRITNYEVSVDKKASIDNLNVVLIADLHLGYNVGVNEIQDMTNKINSINPDVVVLAGDIFDNEFEAIENPSELIKIFNTINPKYGKYAIYGNHDIEEKILAGFTFHTSKEERIKVQADTRMNKFVDDAGFIFLYDDYVLVNNDFYIYGRPDAIKTNFGNTTRLSASEITKDLDKSKTIICLDHQPGELQELANAGVDLDLSGHTHNGQFWPGTITINLAWDNAYGLLKVDNMTSIVTSGVGLFGLNMRTGCFPEIVNIKISFN